MGRIVIDKESCKACNICMEVCPKHLIMPSCETNAHGVNFAEFKDDKKECLGCAICANCCPDAAITEVYKS